MTSQTPGIRTVLAHSPALVASAKVTMKSSGFENAGGDRFVTHFVCEAILAERRRCAEIAILVSSSQYDGKLIAECIMQDDDV